jgi:hypothetical protein
VSQRVPNVTVTVRHQLNAVWTAEIANTNEDPVVLVADDCRVQTPDGLSTLINVQSADFATEIPPLDSRIITFSSASMQSESRLVLVFRRGDSK